MDWLGALPRAAGLTHPSSARGLAGRVLLQVMSLGKQASLFALRGLQLFHWLLLLKLLLLLLLIAPSLQAWIARCKIELKYWKFSGQVLGFLVILSGSSLYNELIRSCLPKSAVSDELSAEVWLRSYFVANS